jgi:tetratricopeptide (TPR) repeat protein
MKPQQTIASLPALEKWYKTSTAGAQRDDLLFVRDVCAALTETENTRIVHIWSIAVESLMQRTRAPLETFLAADSFTQERGLSLSDWFGQVAERALACDMGRHFLETIRKLADKVPLTAFRFLEGWTALNIGDLDACIDACESVQEPWAAVHTLHGQALLEQGEISEAIDVLRVAVTLSPDEILAWFQLAKALLVAKHHSKAFEALQACDRISPGNPEVALLRSMVALGASDSGAATQCIEDLIRHMKNFPTNSDLACNALELSLKVGDKDSYNNVLTNIQFDRVVRNKDFLRRLPPILKALQEKSWYDLAQKTLDCVTSSMD